jgi:N-formylmaleamate deformylase
VEWTSGICRANGIDIHYTRTGDPKSPLLLLHGLTGSGACWRPLARLWEGEYDVVMPDARGHGCSSTPEHGYRYEDLADDVVALIDKLELNAPVLLGHSMGGLTAAVVASRIGTSLRAVVLADPTFLVPERQREVYTSDVLEQQRRLLALSLEDVLAEARTRHPRRSRESIELVTHSRLKTRLVAFDILRPPNPDYHQLVRAIHVPLLLIIGGKGGVVSRETARELQILNPLLQIEEIKDAGHGLVYDQPEAVANAAKSFLAATRLSAARLI